MDEKKQDLSQQYQDILDRYSKELASSSEDVLDKVAPSTRQETPVIDPQPLLNLPPSASPPTAESTISVSIDSLNDFSPKPVSNNIFKYLFFISLLIFLGVFGGIIYSVFFSSPDLSNTNVNNSVPSSSDLVSDPAPIVSQVSSCQVNDRSYPVGESFPADDGCNTCVCSEDLTISCTEKSCEASPSTKMTSPTAVPTKKISMKTHKDTKYQYQFDCPSEAKYQVEATSINGNKIPYKQESCTDKDNLYATVSIYDNTVVHSFGDFQTYISPDKKYVAVIEGDAPELVSSFKFF